MKSWLSAFVAIGVMMGGGVSAQSLPLGSGVEAGVSTLGIYAAPSFAPRDSTTIRVPIFLGAISDTFDVDGTRVQGDLDVRSMGLVADYTFYRGLYLSTGVLFGGYAFTGSADAINTAYGDITGDFQLEVKQTHHFAPVLALGYRYAFFSGVTLRAELGAKVVKHALRVDGLGRLSASDRADVEDEIARLNADLDDIPVVPFITLAVGVVF